MNSPRTAADWDRYAAQHTIDGQGVDFEHYRYLLWMQGDPVNHSAWWITQKSGLQRASRHEVEAIPDDLFQVVETPIGHPLRFNTAYSSTVYRIPR